MEAGAVVGEIREVGVGGAAADAVVGCGPGWRGEWSVMLWRIMSEMWERRKFSEERRKEEGSGEKLTCPDRRGCRVLVLWCSW